MNTLHNLRMILVITAVVLLILMFPNLNRIDSALLSVIAIAVVCYLLYDAMAAYRSRKYRFNFLLLIANLTAAAALFYLTYQLEQTAYDNFLQLKLSAVFYCSNILAQFLKSKRFIL